MRRAVFAILYLIVFIAVGVPLISHLVWHLSAETPLKVLILDKTVIDPKVNEHLSFNWVLNHRKYVKSPGVFYDPITDYKGFYPLGGGKFAIRDFDGFTDAQLDSVAKAYQMAYFTDTYGVYNEEWNFMYPKPGQEKASQITGAFSGILYGGTTQEEVDLLKRFKDQRKLVLTEFNMMASPTGGDARASFESLYDVTWSGWTGRYFLSLKNTGSDELPNWLVNSYEEQRGRRWEFTKSGIVFVDDGGRIVVLEQDTHLKSSLPVITTSSEAHRLRYGIPEKITYPFWFDVTYHGPANHTVSSYVIDPTEEGKALLEKFQLPSSWPAVIASNSGEAPFYYFGGDFADNPITLRTTVFSRVYWLDGLLYNRAVEERGRFFWNYYRPMVTTILNEHFPNNAR